MPDTGGGGSAPEAPDPARTIALQEAANRRNFEMQLRASRPTTTNPYGSSTWTGNTRFDQSGYDQATRDWESQYVQQRPTQVQNPYEGYDDNPRGGVGSWDRLLGQDAPVTAEPSTYTWTDPNAPPRPDRGMYETTDYTQAYNFNPGMQEDWDTMYNRLQSTIAGMPDQSNLDLIDDPRGGYSDALADAIYNRTTRLSGDSMNQAQRALETRLAERGFQVGNEGYNTEMDRMDTQRGEFFSDAADRAQIQASQQALQEAGFTNTARLAEFQADSNTRSQLAQLLSGQLGQMMGGLTGNPSSFAAPAIQTPDVMGAYGDQYAQQLANYNAEQADSGSMFNALLGLGANYLMPGSSALTGVRAGLLGLTGGGSSPYSLASGNSGLGLRF